MKGTLFLSTCVVVVWADIIHATNKQARTNGQNDQAEQGRGVALGTWHLALGRCLCLKTTQTIACHESLIIHRIILF
jgi:lysophospholipid acyltransferase (LPLAT)-like uncharacterized protein